MTVNPLRYQTGVTPTLSDSSAVGVLGAVPIPHAGGFTEWAGEAVDFTTLAAIRSQLNSGQGIYTVTDAAFGAYGDGLSHPLSTRFATLAAAKAVYPRALSLSDQIDGLAIQRAIDVAEAGPGGRVAIPAGVYLSSYELAITHGILVEGQGAVRTAPGATPSTNGATLIFFVGGTNGLHISAPDGTPYRPVVKHLLLRGANYGQPGGPFTDVGVKIRTVCTVEDVVCWQFGSHGFDMDTSVSGNADSSSLRDTWAAQNGGHGYHVVGGDSNACEFSKCSATTNTGYGFYDTGLTNTWVAPHADGNTGGAWYLNGASMEVINPYIEAGATDAVTFATNVNGVLWHWPSRTFSGGTITIANKNKPLHFVKGDRYESHLNFSGTYTLNAPYAEHVALFCVGNVTMALPSNTYVGAEVEYTIWNYNNVTPPVVTWTTGSGAYMLAGALPMASYLSARTIRFRWDSIADRWVEVSRTAADLA